VSVKGFYYCLESYAREVHRLGFRPSCVELARKAAAFFDICIHRHITPDPIGEELLSYTYDLLVKVLKEYHICKDMDTFTSHLCEWSKGLPASQELCKYLLRKRVRWELGKPALHVKLHESPTLRRYDVKCYEVPIYGYAKSSKRFSDTLSEITGSTVSSDVVKNVFGLDEDYNLFEHQISAINELRKPGSRVVIVATPNASGKTEIGLFTAMDIIRGGGSRLVLVVYPTKALARDQFDRWKRRLEGFCKVTPGCNIIGGDKFYLVTNMFQVVLLDGDTIRRLSRVLDSIVSGSNPLVVLTNPQFLLTILQEGSWKRCFGRRCLAFLVLEMESCVRWLKHNYANGCGEHFESYHCGKPVFTSPTIEHTSLAHIAFKSVGENVNNEVLLRVARERMLEPYVNMAAFDVYVNTATPYYLLLLALNGT
jgi:hypothetical protein